MIFKDTRKYMAIIEEKYTVNTGRISKQEV